MGVPVDEPDDTRAVFSYAAGARVLIGLAGIGGLAYQYHSAQDDMRLADRADASAVQIVQLWTPHIFYAIVIIGLVMSAYIITRVSD